MLLNVSANTAGQIATGISGVQFSPCTSLIVPGLVGEGYAESVMFAPIAEIPSEHSEFAKMCEAFEPPYQIDSRWGEMEVSSTEDEVEPGTFVMIRKESALHESEISFLMSSGNGVPNYIQAELSFHSPHSQFRFTQFARLPVEFRDDRVVAKSAMGIGGIAIASGLELLKRTAQIKEFAESYDFAENTTWMRIVRSLGLDDEDRAGSLEIIPHTALYIAMLFHEELYADSDEEMAISVPKHKNHIFSPSAGNGSIAVDEKARSILQSGEKVTFASVEEGLGYSPSGPVSKVPRYEVSFLPSGSYSDVHDTQLGYPLVEILQTAIFDTKRAEPFVSTVADLMTAAWQMHPQHFPLAESE
jgi:hypothetical protein